LANTLAQQTGDPELSALCWSSRGVLRGRWSAILRCGFATTLSNVGSRRNSRLLRPRPAVRAQQFYDPTLITADLGLIVEVPDPIRIALVGVVRCFLPNADAPILKLQANFLGTVDLDRGRLSFDASLFDSRLLSFTLEGDMSARLSLLPFPNYLSVGGFHPAYTPPPLDIPAMRRLTINLLGGSNPRLRAEVYFARNPSSSTRASASSTSTASWDSTR